jgi:dTDP-4-dehydrorhamnose 3,5-epimerase
MLKIETTPLKGLLIIEPVVYTDSRGHFVETYQDLRYREMGVADNFVQDNLAFSHKDVLRGLHFQIKSPQAKLIQAISGEIYDVAVDVRPGSATFGQWFSVQLSAQNRRQLLVPAGFAHGYCVLTETATVIYKCSDYYHPEDEGGVLWSDPAIGIDWPVRRPVVSDKDEGLPLLETLGPEQLPQVEIPS